MRKIFLTGSSFLILTACASTVAVTEHTELITPEPIVAYSGLKNKVAVTKFENNTRFGERRLGDNISDVLITELSKTQRFIILERDKIDEILAQVTLSQMGLTEGFLDEIELLDADFIITGSITQYSVVTTGSSNLLTQSKLQTAKVAADVRLINVRTGEIVLATSGQGSAESRLDKVLGMGQTGGYNESLEMEAFRAAVIQVTENILASIDQTPWTCDVVKITGLKVYIDAGRRSNIQLGDRLGIYTKGKAIMDLSGIILGYDEIKIAEGIVTNYIGDNGAVVTMNSLTELILPLYCKGITTNPAP